MLPAIYGRQRSAQPRPRPPAERRKGKGRQKVISVKKSELQDGLMDVDMWRVVGSTKDQMGVRLQVQVWLDSFNQEREKYKSITAYAELFYARVLGATEALPEPNLLRTATCMMLLEQISSLFERYKPLFMSLYGQLEHAIFIDTYTPPSIDDPAINEVLCSKYIRTTYFDAYAELLQQHDKLQSKSTAMEDAMTRQMKVLQHAIRTWQRAFLEKVFLGWRGYVTRQKHIREKYKSMFSSNIAKIRMQTAWRNWCVSLDHVKLQSAKDGASAVGSAVERLKAKCDALQEELEAKEALLDQKEQRITALQQENASLKSDKRAAYEKYTTSQNTVRKLCNFIAERLSELKSPKLDWLARRRVEGMIQQSDGGLDLLVAWANALIKEQCGDQYFISDFAEQVRTGKPFLYLLRSMAPAYCSEGWLIRCVGEIDVSKRCEEAITTAKSIGVIANIKVEDILKGMFEINYMFLAQCFRRFADPGASKSRVILWDSAPEISMRDHSNHEKVTQEEWSERWQSAAEVQKMWVDKVAEVNMKLEEEMTDSMRRGMAKVVMSKKQDEQQSLYCDVPLNSFADLLSATRGAGTPKEMHMRVVKMLRSNYNILRKVFKYYCMADALKVGKSEAVLESMSFAEFSKLLSDCKLTKIKPNLSLVIGRLRQDISISIGGIASGTQDRINPKEFSLALIHIAAKKYNDDELADRLRRLVHEHIAPHAKASAAEQFKGEVYSPAVQFVIGQYRDDIGKAYQEVSRQDPSQKKDANMTIDMNEWVTFVKSNSLVDAMLTIPAVKQIFHSIQDDVEDDSTLTMNLSEFTEAIASLSFYKYPSPFEPFSQRLLRFFKTNLFDK